MDPLNVFDYELLAKERMDPASWDFYAGGSDDEVTLRANQADFARIRLRPRVLVDVSHCDTSTVCSACPCRCLSWLRLPPCTVWLILKENARRPRELVLLARSWL